MNKRIHIGKLAGRKLFAILLIVMSAIVALGIKYKRDITGQNPPPGSAAAVVIVRDTNANAAFVSSAFSPAAIANNINYRATLNWFFGGKAQRGWLLYTPLIKHTIGTDQDCDNFDFAVALSRWQQSAGLAATGILDDATWSNMIEHWQARRIQDRVSPPPTALIVAPPSDFYDPDRAAELRQVERETYAAYKRLIAAAAADPSLGLNTTSTGELAPSEQRLKIISAYRSQAYQERLRKLDPKAGRAGLALRSPHLTGRTIDLYIGGYDPVSTEDANRLLQTNTPVYRWLVKNAEKFGFYPYFYEPWHWEYHPQ